MRSSIRPHLALLVLLASLLAGCSGKQSVRGDLIYDLRPKDQRSLIVWPADADVPRYRYLGELVGEPNFVDVGSGTRSSVVSALYWMVGVNEQYNPTVLRRPIHGTVGDKGRVYVADSGNNAIFVFDPTAPADEDSDRGAGQLLVWKFAAPLTRFASPVAITMAWRGDVAVSDSTLGIVARIDPTGTPVATIGAGQLGRPTGLAFDAARGLLYVADTLTHDIKVYDEAGRLVNTFGSPGQGQGQFNAPTHLAFANKRLYVTDTLNTRIQVFDGEGRHLSTLGERGLAIGNMVRPKGVAAGDAGIVYVVESYFGHLLAFAENGQFLMSINGSGLKDGKFLLPAGVWTDGRGRIFVADMFNGRVVVYQFLEHDGG